MKRTFLLLVVLGLVACWAGVANAVTVIGGSTNNGNLDRTYAQEIVPGFFLPKPQVWQNVGTRTLGGPYEDEMASEPWAGPAPTPVTTDNFLNAPAPAGCGNVAVDGDCGVFFKPFSGGGTNGPATGSLYQDNPGTPGMKYILTGWAGAEANALMADAVLAIDFLNAGNSRVGGNLISLLPTLFVPNGQSFNYKQYMVMATAPVGTTTVRARVSMIDAISNPSGGGQAFVVDDFRLDCVPEPATLVLAGIAMIGWVVIRRRAPCVLPQ